MPWKEPGEKPREPNEPWGTGQRPGNRPPRPGDGFDLDARLQRLRRELGPLGKGPGGLLALIAVAVVLWFALGSWTLIDARETGVVLRFGKFQRVLEPGLHLHLPRPFAQVLKVDTGRNRTVSDQLRMLTRDGQIALVDFYVQYRVTDARRFLFAVRDPEDAMRQATLTAVRTQIGTQTMAQLTAGNNAALAAKIRTNLQHGLDGYQSGIAVGEAGIQNISVPQEVRDAQQDIGNARQDAQRMENDAHAAALKGEADADAQAAQSRADADLYKARTIAGAQAEAARFRSVLVAYQAAPDATRQRLWLQAMQDVLGASRVVIDTTGRAVVQLPPPPPPPRANDAVSPPAPAAAQKPQGGSP